MSKLAIIGASELQNPLILKAKTLGHETHVFAWEAGDIGETTADDFYPISITEKDEILAECRRIGVDGVCTIASDLANITVGYVADAMGLPCNSPEAIVNSTNKSIMRRVFAEHGDPSPKSIPVSFGDSIDELDISFPVIVKPIDRSGSRGITRVENADQLEGAIQAAREVGFSDTVLVEEFAYGREFSVEHISWDGHHRFLAITEKFTTGHPNFIETGHLEPARLDDKLALKAEAVVSHALDSLGVKLGASHSEIKITEDGTIRIIEIGSRMGGDCIGSDLVALSTGYDFLKGVIDCALGIMPEEPKLSKCKYAAIRYIFDEEDLAALETMEETASDLLVYESPLTPFGGAIGDSSARHGFFIFAHEELTELERFLPPASKGGAKC